MDLCVRPWLRVPMGERTPLTASEIYTKIGIIMEDASLVALKLGGSRAELEPAKLHELETAVDEINQLMRAAQTGRDGRGGAGGRRRNQRTD